MKRRSCRARRAAECSPQHATLAADGSIGRHKKLCALPARTHIRVASAARSYSMQIARTPNGKIANANWFVQLARRAESSEHMTSMKYRARGHARTWSVSSLKSGRVARPGHGSTGGCLIAVCVHTDQETRARRASRALPRPGRAAHVQTRPPLRARCKKRALPRLGYYSGVCMPT